MSAPRIQSKIHESATLHGVAPSIAVSARTTRVDLERKDLVNPIGVDGPGEIGFVGTGAAIANPIDDATCTRFRCLPITIEGNRIIDRNRPA